MSLSAEELTRYSRHLLLPEIGREGQGKLAAAKVLILGMGGLGSPVAMYLAASGIGTLGIVDFDKVDQTNLQRQIIHSTSQIGHLKVSSAQTRLNEINPHCIVITYPFAIQAKDIRELIRGYDLVIDCSDNFPTRYMVNDACILENKPNIYGAVYRFEGHASAFIPSQGPCYRCLYPEPPDPKDIPNCSRAGVFSVLPGIIGMIQATEALKVILKIGNTLAGRLIILDSLDMKFRELKVPHNPDCAVCGTHPTIKEPFDYSLPCPDSCTPAGLPDDDLDLLISVQELKRWLDDKRPLRLLDIREPQEWEFNHIPGAEYYPMTKLYQNWQDLNPDQEYVLYCHTGIRTFSALQFLRQHQLLKTWSLNGGIDSWSVEIDSAISRY